jgi:DNA-directed RNA polymerase subunit RPC12/RpoP
VTTCATCQAEFTKQRMGQRVCSPACASKIVRREKAEERATLKKRKEAIKTIPQLIKEAQIEFNAYIRERDRQAGHPCISSGRPLDWSGNWVDAGHYRSTGAASHLRFNEDNCHAQSKHDNQYLAGNAVDYRLRLVARIGLARVEALEADNDPIKWDRETLRQIKTIYRAKLRELKKGQQ